LQARLDALRRWHHPLYRPHQFATFIMWSARSLHSEVGHYSCFLFTQCPRYSRPTIKLINIFFLK
jgi:hypothetical protein